MTTAIYAVEGLTCGYCMAEVLENVHSLSGVTDVAMDLVTDGQSPLTVMSMTKLGADAVREAVERAGFDLITAEGRVVRGRRDSPFTRDGDIRPDRELMTSSLGGARS
jgi:copper chaperone